MKTAFLVSFCPMTRVVVDVELEDDPNIYGLFDKYRDKIILAAREQIIDNGIEEYLNGDNLEDIITDEECPYPQSYDI